MSRGTRAVARGAFLLFLLVGWTFIAAASVDYFSSDVVADFVLEKLPVRFEELWLRSLEVHVASALLCFPLCLVLATRFLHRARPLLGELLVVVLGAGRVRVADDVECLDLRVVLEKSRDVIEELEGVGEDLVAVEGEVDVTIDDEVVALDAHVLGIRGGSLRRGLLGRRGHFHRPGGRSLAPEGEESSEGSDGKNEMFHGGNVSFRRAAARRASVPEADPTLEHVP